MLVYALHADYRGGPNQQEPPPNINAQTATQFFQSKSTPFFQPHHQGGAVDGDAFIVVDIFIDRTHVSRDKLHGGGEGRERFE